MVEAALITPTLLLLFVGIVDYGLALYAYDGAVTATKEAAKFGANGATTANTFTVFSNNFNLINRGDNTYTDAWVIRFQTDSSGNVPTSSPAYSVTNSINGSGPGTGADTYLAPSTVQGYINAQNANATGTANIKFVIVQVYYEHPVLFGWFGPRIPISAWSMQRDVTP